MDKGICSVPVCDRPAYHGRLCNAHRMWSYKHGGLEPTHRIWPRGDAAEVLRRRTIVDPETGCHLWTGSRDRKGYGHLMHDGRLRPAHRVAWELVNGPVPEGLELDHVHARGCRYKTCVNLDHLEPVTGLENMRRRFAAERARS